MIFNTVQGGGSDDFIVVEMQTVSGTKTLIFTGVPFNPARIFVVNKSLATEETPRRIGAVFNVNGTLYTFPFSNSEGTRQMNGSATTAVTYDADTKTLTITMTSVIQSYMPVNTLIGLFYKT